MNFATIGKILTSKTSYTTVTLLVILLLALGVNPNAQAQSMDFNLSGTASISTERGGPNLGVDFSRTGANATISARAHHKSCAFIEGATGNGNDNWNYIHEISVGCLKKLDGGKVIARAEAHLINLDGAERDVNITSVRGALITNYDFPVKPYVFAQQVLDGPAGDGFALRPGVKLPFGTSVEAGFQCGFFGQDECVHAFNRYNIDRPVPGLEGFVLSVGYLDKMETDMKTTVSKDRWQVTLKKSFTF